MEANLFEEEYLEFKYILKKEKIKTIFQPIVSLKDSSILGYEALSRGQEDSIIPFNLAFQSIRILRISKMIKFIKIFRAASLILKLRNYMNRFLKVNNFNYVIWVTLFTLILGAVGIHFAEDISIGNALWWSFVTITTVGYGDISPGTPTGRIIAGIIMLVGIGFLGMLTGTIATFFLRKNCNANFKSQTIEDIKSKLDDFDELNIEDINNICNVLIALKNRRYIQYKEDISNIFDISSLYCNF